MSLKYWQTKAQEIIVLYGKEDAIEFLQWQLEIARESSATPEDIQDQKAIQQVLKSVEEGKVTISSSKRSLICQNERSL